MSAGPDDSDPEFVDGLVPAEEDGDDDADLPDKLFFRIGEAAELVGVEPHVLRYWESEFEMRPERSTSGQRMYRRKDIARFLHIRRLLHDEGFTIAGARKALLDPTAEPSPTSMAASRIHQALERLTVVRQRIAEVRARLDQIGLNTPP
jgi:DNA-binding transcriptional MerR regulator